MGLHRDLTNAQWDSVEALFREFRARKDPRGRPERNTRAVLNAAFWILSTGGPWSTLPSRYPDHRTCHRRFKAWFEAGVLQRVLRELHGEAGETMFEAMAARMRTTHTASAGKTAPVPGARLRRVRNEPRGSAGERGEATR